VPDPAPDDDTYCEDEDRPLRSYAGILVTHLAIVGGALGVAARQGRLPAKVRAADLALGAVATFKLSRLLTRSTIASPLRAPFTVYRGVSGPAELEEEVRGHGLRHAVGELLTCPFCLGHWVATAFCLGLVYAPELTRTAGAVLAMDAGADVLHFANARLAEEPVPEDTAG
jgi:hypothetical protein